MVKKWLLFLALFDLAYSASLFADDSVTITTYYPSPSGHYNTLDSTGNTYLATSAGSQVGIGTSSPSDQLEITGNFRIPATAQSGGVATAGVIKFGGSNVIHLLTPNSFFAGYGSGNMNMTGNSNTAVGSNTMTSLTKGATNTAMGNFALSSVTEGYRNSAFGANALASLIGKQSAPLGGYDNTAVGSMALNSVSTGFQDTAIGSQAGNAVAPMTTGSNNTFIGYNTGSTANNLTNATAIGANATVGASNAMVLGNGVSVGIGTSTPSATLHVVGNAIISGGLKPDYDSRVALAGWTYVNNGAGGTGNNDIVFAHGLGVVPSHIEVQACGAVNGVGVNMACTTRVVMCGTRGYQDGYTYINPLSVEADTVNIYVAIHSSWWVWGFIVNDTPVITGDADGNPNTGYYRVLAWK